MPDAEDVKESTPLRVATIEVLQVVFQRASEGDAAECRLVLRNKLGKEEILVGHGTELEDSVADVVSQLCRKPIRLAQVDVAEQHDGQLQCVVAVAEASEGNHRGGVGRYVADNRELGLTIAALRAASHAGMLRAAYRANHQKVLRGWSQDIMEELSETLELGSIGELKRLEAEGVVLEHLNRVASAAVVTAANSPKPDSILSLFDTSAWLYDNQGRRRDSYTDTSLWLAWYPGIENADLIVDEVINSMPAAPQSKIPWIVKLFENPESWMRFRGAVDLEDHDVLHVLLGRGLQDQDEAFVLGFAMGTAKRVSWFEYRVFKFVLARIYPEPYRIPRFLQPAFDLGVKCGKETGARQLYRQHLKSLRGLTLSDARRKAGIDMDIVKKYFELEQQRIPFTIASLRLP